MMGQREFGQPALAAHRPQLIGWAEGVRRVEGPKVDADLIVEMGIDRRAAGGAEKAALLIAGLARHGDGGFGEDGRAVKQRAVVLAAV
jgi:hypothetical protein